MTLAEVLTALAVLSIGIVALISLLPLAGFGVHEGAHRSSAVFLASQRLEQIRLAVGSGERVIAFADEASLTPPHGAFGRTVRVRDCELAPGCSGHRDRRSPSGHGHRDVPCRRGAGRGLGSSRRGDGEYLHRIPLT